MKQNSKQSFLFVIVVVAIDAIGMGIIIPILPELLMKLTGKGLSEAAVYGGGLMFAYSIMQFVFAPILGELSDQYGRRPILLLSMLGLGLDYIFHAYAPTITWLFVGRLLAGLTGASFSVANSYIADVSEPDKKAQNFGMIGAAFGIGFTVGPAIGGIVGQYGTEVPFLIAAGLSLLNFVYGLFVLPESLPKADRRTFDWKRANPVGNLLHLRQYQSIFGLIIAFFLAYVAGFSVQAVWVFYTEYKFGWDSKMVGYSLMAAGLVFGISQAALVRPVVKLLGERRTIIIAFLLWSVGLVLFGFASAGWMMFAFLIPYGLGGIGTPTLQGFMSNQLPKNEQGELQGAISSLMGLASIVSPLIMTALFYYFTSEEAPVHFPGAPFVLGMSVMLLGTLIAFLTLNKFEKTKLQSS